MPGKLYSWGDNRNGTLGNGYRALRATPEQTITDGDWETVSVGNGFAIALKSGKLYSWGVADSYQTGQGNTTSLATPTQIGSETNWESFAIGDRYVLAIKTDGTLWTWGLNTNGRTGRGLTSGTTNNPTQVGTATNWKNVSAGITHSLGVRDDGTLWTWGGAANGRLGNGTTTPDVSSPAQIGTATNWSDVSAGENYSLAIKTDGTLWAWGGNASSQLGNGNTTEQTSPIQIGTDTNWSKISAGKGSNRASLAIKTTGTLWGWGTNGFGLTGRGTSVGTTTTPTQVGTATDWNEVNIGISTVFAIKGNKLWTWGHRAGTTVIQLNPLELDSNTIWNKISVWSSAFSIRGGNLYFTGLNVTGLSGENVINTYTTSPAQVGTDTDWSSIAQDGNDTAGGTVFYGHVMAIKNGKLFGFGEQNNGCLGNNVNNNVVKIITPTQSGTDTDWDIVSTGGGGGSNFSIGIRNGSLYSWGNNSQYQLGLSNNNLSRLIPTQVGSNTDWELVSSGNYFSIALRGGKLYSWGSNARGKTGQGITASETQSPTQIGTDTDWETVDCGNEHTLAIKTNGTLWAWGYAANGRLGNNTTTPDLSVPTQIGTDTDWAIVCSGVSASFAIKTDGTLWAWGNNSNGRTGLGTPSGNTLVPTKIGTATNWSKLSAGESHSLAIKTDGTLWSWGFNNYGALGIGSTSQQTSPTQVGTGNDWTDILAATNYSIAIESSGAPPVNTDLPSVSGTKRVGETLTTTNGTWTGDPAPTYTYKWQVSNDGLTGWSDISGATSSTFVLTSAQSGKYVRSQVTATNDSGAVAAESASTTVINETPSISSLTISGSAAVGETLTANISATGYPTPTYTYQWEQNSGSGWSNISGATSSTYTLTSAESGKTIRVSVVATNSEGTDSETSAATLEVGMMPEVTDATISGIAIQDEILTVTATAVGFPAPTLTYQWQRSNDDISWHNINGETEDTLLLVPNETHRYIRCIVTATNIYGSDVFTTDSVGPVQAYPVAAIPIISGTAKPGNTLTTTADFETGYPEPDITIIWQYSSNNGVSWQNTANTTTTYPLTTTDLGRLFRTQVTVTNILGTDTATSASYGPVVSEPVLVTAPTISGTAIAGQTLTSTPGTYTAYPAESYAYQWQISNDGSTGWANISGATSSSLTLTTAHTQKYVRISVTASNSEGSTTNTSSASAQVREVPANTVLPSISGDTVVNEQLTAAPGTWTGFPSPSYSYQWQRNAGAGWLDISGATASTYTLTIVDAFCNIRVRVTGSNNAGSAQATSAQTAMVTPVPAAPVNTEAPSIVGLPQLNETLSANTGEWAAYPEPEITFIWQKSLSPDGPWETITDGEEEEISLFTLVGDDLLLDESYLGYYIQIVVTAENSEGSSEETSAVVGPIVSLQFTKGTILPVSNARLLEIIAPQSIGIDYDSEYNANEDPVVKWLGDADAYVNFTESKAVKLNTSLGGGLTDRFSEISVTIPYLTNVDEGSILVVLYNGEEYQWKVREVVDARYDVGLPEIMKCYVVKL